MNKLLLPPALGLISTLVIIIGCRGTPATPTRAPASPHPTLTLEIPGVEMRFQNSATGKTKDGQVIVITTVQIIQVVPPTEERPTGGYDTGNKMLVSRGNTLFWLKSSTTPDKFGCGVNRDTESYDNFGCFLGGGDLVDLDQDGEPEIVSGWGHDGTGSYGSFHLHRWDGQMYQLIGELYESQL